MYKVKLSPEEALETIKLRMKYDSSKTLTENVGIVDEQGLAGNPMTGQASGGQTYGITYNDDTSGTKWYDVFVKWNGSAKSKVTDDQFWSYASKGDIWNFKKNGKFGPRTSKAWSTYKDEYLKGTNTPTVTPTPTGNPDLEVDDKEASFDQPF